MKNTIYLTLIATLSASVLLIFYLLALCKSVNPNNNNGYNSTEVYTVLVEKALTLQADSDMEAWIDMLADDVIYSFPDDGENNQTVLVGKVAVRDYWLNWQKNYRVKSLSFTGFTHAPFIATKNLNVYSLPGTYVFSLFKSKMVFDNGKTVELYMNYCCHFNKDKRIDRCFTFYDRSPMMKAVIPLSSYNPLRHTRFMIRHPTLRDVANQIFCNKEYKTYKNKKILRGYLS